MLGRYVYNYEFVMYYVVFGEGVLFIEDLCDIGMILCWDFFFVVVLLKMICIDGVLMCVFVIEW